MELSSLRAFVAVAQELHFGRASLLLGCSQPQVSRHIQALEDELGVALFIRTPRRTELTDAGRLLLDDARATLASVDRLRARAGLARRGAAGSVSVAFLWSTLGACLAPLVAAANERHDRIELTVSQITFLEILPSLRRGDIDVALARPLWEPHELVERTLRLEPSVVALPAAHRLAARDAIELDELCGEPMVAFHRALVPTAYDAAMERARDAGLELEIVQHVRSASEALALVSAGIGCYRMPAVAATPFPGVVYRELTDAPTRLVLVHRPLPAPAVQAIIELADELFGDASGASNDAGLTLASDASAA